MAKPVAGWLLDAALKEWTYPREVEDALLGLAELTAEPQDIELLFGGWGMPRLDAERLAGMPRLRAVFYGAGSVKKLVTPAFWERGIPLVSAWAMNAVAVAEFTLAQVILALKHAHAFARDTRRARRFVNDGRYGRSGAYGATVGLVSLGEIGRRVAGLLSHLDVRLLAYDPYAGPEAAAGVEMTGLEELFDRSDVVSIHAPWLPETEGLIGAHLLSRLRHGATLINTSRGAVIDEPELVRVLAERPDLFAVLDVTHPEPPASDSPLYTLENVCLTPHLAGSQDRECARMGFEMVAECRRFLAGEPLRWEVTPARLERGA